MRLCVVALVMACEQAPQSPPQKPVTGPAPTLVPPRPAPADAAAAEDATFTRDDIIALSRYGFFSITASANTTIFVDGKRIGETPMIRLPLAPGSHKVTAVGPDGKTKDFAITIVGGREIVEGPIAW